MATFHGLPQFDDTTDRWDAFKIRLEAYFEAHDFTEVKKKRALVVSTLSTRTVEVLAGWCAPTKINELEYSEVVQLLHDHFSPQRNEIAESYKFFTRSQRPGESVKEFIFEIRKIADNWNFGEVLDRMLRDRIVCGLHDSGVRRKPLAKPILTRQQGEEIALASELAALNVQQMEGNRRTRTATKKSVHSVEGDKNPGGRRKEITTTRMRKTTISGGVRSAARTAI
ncbi:unnamed protein product [Ixodes persulcatus]